MPNITIKDWNLSAMEKAIILEAMAASKDITAASALLGISRHRLSRKLLFHGLHPTQSPPPDGKKENNPS